MEDKKGLSDILGIKPIANAVDKSVEGAYKFLSLVSKPALEEFGFLLRDQVQSWRMNNIIKILEKAKGKIAFNNGQLEIHPKIALAIIDNGSMEEEEELQDMWAGLFAASCLEEKDDENLIFVDMLKKITVVEARLIKCMCENVRIILYNNGLFKAANYHMQINLERLSKITGINDMYRLDRELNHLRSLDLLAYNIFGGNYAGFSLMEDEPIAKIWPSTLALGFYQKCIGSKDDPKEFWKEQMISEEEHKKEMQEKEEEKNNVNKKEEKQDK